MICVSTQKSAVVSFNKLKYKFLCWREVIYNGKHPPFACCIHLRASSSTSIKRLLSICSTKIFYWLLLTSSLYLKTGNAKELPAKACLHRGESRSIRKLSSHWQQIVCLVEYNRILFPSFASLWIPCKKGNEAVKINLHIEFEVEKKLTKQTISVYGRMVEEVIFFLKAFKCVLQMVNGMFLVVITTRRYYFSLEIFLTEKFFYFSIFTFTIGNK